MLTLIHAIMATGNASSNRSAFGAEIKGQDEGMICGMAGGISWGLS
jgi:hypothetical protein